MGPALGRGALVVLVAAFLLSLIGDGVVSFSLILDAVASGHPAAVTAVFLAELLLPVVLASRIGALADRGPLRWVWVGALGASGALSALAAGIDVLGVRIALLALASVCAVAASACAFKAVPWVAGSRGPSRINGALSSVRSMASLAAPALGGVAYLAVGTTAVLVFNAVTFAALAGAVAALLASYPRPGADRSSDQEALAPAAGARARRVTGLQALRASPMVWSLLPIVAGVVFATSIEGVAGVFWLREVAGDSVVFGLVLAAWAAGAIPGALLAGRGTFGDVEHRLIIGGAGVMAAVFLSVPFTTAPAVLAVMFLLGGAGNGAHNVGLTTAVHRFVAPARHGAAWAQLRAVINTCVVLGYLAGTPNDLLGPRTLIFISGVLAAAVTLYGLSAMRRLDAARRAEEPQP